MSEHDFVDGLAEVLPQVPPIRDLDRLRGSCGSTGRVVAAAVPADDLDVGLGGQPSRHGVGLPVRQYIDRAVAVHVDHDG